MKIIFAGTPEFAAVSLQALIDAGHEIIAVYTQPDRPAGRGKKLMASEVKQVAQTYQIPVYQPLNFKAEESLKELRSLNADLMIVAAYGIILPKEVLEAPRMGCINIHGSLLPRWRGAAPIQRAIQAGDQDTGITIMQMDEGLDTGDMLLKMSIPIEESDTGGSLHDKLAKLGAKAILAYFNEFESGKLKAEKQNNDSANYAHKLSKQEAQLNWNQPASELERTIRAFNPWPVCYSETSAGRIRIFEAEVSTTPSGSVPGTVLEKNRDGICVSCAEGAVRITSLQLPGGKRLNAEQFFNGGKDMLNPGNVL